jgi:hypothetical protein
VNSEAKSRILYLFLFSTSNQRAHPTSLTFGCTPALVQPKVSTSCHLLRHIPSFSSLVTPSFNLALSCVMAFRLRLVLKSVSLHSPFSISDLPFQVTCLPRSHLQPLFITPPLISNHFIDCQRRLDVINRGLVAIFPSVLLQS